MTANYNCPTGITQNVRVPSAATVAVTWERGGKVARLVTPRVRSVARDLFGCAALAGMELENQPTTTAACWGSHWEQRLLPFEVRC